ncbi:MAG TPA: ABC transporter permease [Gemmatimonadaceae bacterium]|nr:ABC transporter permease [Gemmatimonadaceae bacterium]
MSMPLDVRYALRSLARSPGFTIAVVLTLGLGIGANTAIFSAVRGVLLKPLPNRNGDRLMYLRHSAVAKGSDNIAFSVPEINDFREQSKTLAEVAEYSPLTLNLVETNGASQIQVGLVTGNYFKVMGLAPVIGHGFSAKDDGPGVPPVIMLTYGYWLTHFGGDSAIVGTSLRIGGKNAEVVGVLQPAPFFPQKIDALMNMSVSDHHVSATMIQGRTHRMTEMIARLAPGVTVDQARAEVAQITKRVHADHPDVYDVGSGYAVTLTPFKEVLGKDARLTLLLLMGVAGFVLVIACANVANLTLMRGVRREHEMVVRAALGAGAARLRRLLFVEHLLLAFAGAAVGLALAFAGTGMLSAFTARMSNRADDIRVDGVVLAFTLAVAVGVALLLSFAPRVGREYRLGASLTGSRTTGSRKRRGLQRALVVTQIAVSVILLAGAALLVKSVQKLAEVDPGLDTHNVLTMEVPADFAALQDRDQAVSTYERMAAELKSIPGVEVVGMGSNVPLRATQFNLDVKAEGRALAVGEPVPQAEYRTADPGYFRASGIKLLAGREFTATDNATSGKVVIINQTLAKLLWPGQDPLGRRLTWTGDVLRFIGMKEEWRTVVGVVADTKDGGLDAKPVRAVFMPFAQGEFPTGALVLRTDVNPMGLARAAREVVHSIAPEQPVEKVMALDAIRDESVVPRRVNALLVGSFGVLALVIAAIGIAAVLAFSVSARTGEIGVRMSLGARPGQVLAMVLREGGVLVLAGLAIGVVGALVLARYISALLFEVAPHDPATLAIVGTVMAAIGVAACCIPAVRAARIAPSEALRAQ